MIGYLEGTVLHFDTEGILLLAGAVGYEVMLNVRVLETLRTKQDIDESISLYVYYHQTERQPRPVLIGFLSLEEKAFFQAFITVDAIGPLKAVKAMTRPVGEIALAIEKKDADFLAGLQGIGRRTAEKIIATLNGKMGRFVSVSQDESSSDQDESLPEATHDIRRQVEDVLVDQLGHSHASARRMIRDAFVRNQTISTPEALFDEIFRENSLP